MRTRVFISVIVLMSVALAGIVLTQLFLINRAIQEKQEQFRLNANQAVKTSADKIQQRELKDFVDVMIDTNQTSKIKTFSGLRILHIDEKNNEEFIYSNDFIEKDFGISKDTKYDSVDLKQIISRRMFRVKKNKKNPENRSVNSEYLFKKMGHINEIDKALFYTSYKDIADRIPIEYRVSKSEIDLTLEKELKDRDMDVNFEYAIYQNNKITKIKSKEFDEGQESENNFQTPLLPNNEGYTPYKLVVSFPNKNAFLISSILLMSILSGIFTLVIIMAYGYTLYQSIYQRRASRIKTDFINNMTHEFKTPIATISLALDSLKNDKISGHEAMRKKYLKIIGEENERMHSQVEHILKISRFQRGKFKIDTEVTQLRPIIDNAIAHVRLIVESKDGSIKTNYPKEEVNVKVNMNYFINMLTNVLDNAIKYSTDKLAIDIHLKIDEQYAFIEISDQGIGMSKSAQKKVFQKFYREQSGDIHNVKGHGLGLAFVRYVVEAHDGEVSVESEKDKGSTFCIKLPLA